MRDPVFRHAQSKILWGRGLCAFFGNDGQLAVLFQNGVVYLLEIVYSVLPDLADKLLVKLEQAIDELDLQVTTHKIKTERANTEETTEFRVAVPGGMVDRAGLRQLTGALKEIKIIKDEISDLERREREARIDALRRSSMTADGDDDETGIILLPPRQE